MNASERRVLYAFALNREVGVDIEHIHYIPKMDQIVERFFSVKENDVLRALPESKKKEAFFNCWTRKEAFIKAIGKGMSYPLDRFNVSFTSNDLLCPVRIDGDFEQASE